MEKIQAQLILEILGRPAEHVKEALNTMVMKLGAEPGIKLIEKTYHEPIKVPESRDLYTAFAEVIIEFEKIENYFGVIFAYMPAHIEIIHPTHFSFSNFDFNELGNKIIHRLHEYDALTKTVVNERNFLFEKLKEYNPELAKQLTTKPQEQEPKKEKKNPNPKKKPTKKKSKK